MPASSHSADWRRILEGFALVAGRVAADSRLAGRLASAATKGGGAAAAVKPKASSAAAASSTSMPTSPDSAAFLSAAQAVLREAQQRLFDAWTAAERFQKPEMHEEAAESNLTTTTATTKRQRFARAPSSAPVPLSSAVPPLAEAATGRSLTFSSLPSGIGSSSYYALSTPPQQTRRSSWGEEEELATAGGADFPPFASTERRVPSSALARALGFARLGVSMAAGVAVDRLSAALGGGGEGNSGSSRNAPGSASSSSSSSPASSHLVSEASAERLAAALCRMRGAALKLGQMLSIQDDALLPPALASALARARAGADIMPRSQLAAALAAELGPRWREEKLFAEFEDRPMAAASIGQVHRATVVLEDEEGEEEEVDEEGEEAEAGNEKAERRGEEDGGGGGGASGDGGEQESSPTKKKQSKKKKGPKTMAVAVKVQYPGVADSVVADVDNLLRVASLTGEHFFVLFCFFCLG